MRLADADIEVHRGVPYATPAGDPLRLALYRLSGGANGAARRAAVVLVPGSRGRAPEHTELARYALDLAERGYVCAVPAYRGSDVAAFPAQIRDLKAAIRWLRATAAAVGVDADRIGAFGHGTGAHLAVLAAVSADTPSLAPAADDFAGVGVDGDAAVRASDALAAVVGVGGTYALEHQPETDDLVALLGGDRESAAAAWERASPSTYLGSGAALGDSGPALGDSGAAGDSAATAVGAESGMEPPPTLLLHGEDDDAVPAMASELFHDLLEEADVTAECVVAAEAGHDVHETQRAFTLGWTEAFFDRHLR
ncbi:alpha/beta hydrolase [Halobellus sp. Atlit-31R]|nr:alpha/beta hydrolase [Halobellus sp. Atlit-31R]